MAEIVSCCFANIVAIMVSVVVAVVRIFVARVVVVIPAIGDIRKLVGVLTFTKCWSGGKQLGWPPLTAIIGPSRMWLKVGGQTRVGQAEGKGGGCCCCGNCERQC